MVYIFKHLLSGPEERTVGFSFILPVLDKKPNSLAVWLHVLQVKHRKSRYGYAYPKGQTKALVPIFGHTYSVCILRMYVYIHCMYDQKIFLFYFARQNPEVWESMARF